MVSYADLTKKYYGMLVRMRNGDYHVVIEVDGVGSGQLIHVHTREGAQFWAQREMNEKLYEV